MGRHSRPEEKHLSFIASSGTMLGGLALVVGLLTATSIIVADRPDPPSAEAIDPPFPHPEERDRNDAVTTDLASANVDLPESVTGRSVVQGDTDVPGASTPLPPGTTGPTQPPRPTEPPIPPITRVVPSVDVDTNVRVPGVAEAEVDAKISPEGLDLDARLDIPLLEPIVLPAATKVVKVINKVTDPVTKLLGE